LIADTPSEADAVYDDLRELAGDASVSCFPQRETLPYEDSDPHLEISAQRVEALGRLLAGRTSFLVATARGLIERMPMPTLDGDFGLRLRVGDEVGLRTLTDRLDEMGFERAPTVQEVGEYAVRGGIIDAYAFGHPTPLRIELWGDEIASLRRFDLLTQRSIEPIAEIEILPIDLKAPDEDSTASMSSPSSASTARSLLEVLPDSVCLLLLAPQTGSQRRRHLWEETVAARRHAPDGALPAEALVLPPEDAERRIAEVRRIEIDEEGETHAFEPPTAVERDMGRLISVLGAARGAGDDVLILCDNEGQVERLEEILVERGGSRLAREVTLGIGSLSGGFRIDGPRPLLVLTDHEIFRRSRRLRGRARFRGVATLESIASIGPGDYVVHMDHGIGRYRGIQRVDVGGETIETLEIEYADGEVLRLPHYRLDLIERWSTSGLDAPDSPPRVHKLGGKRWKQLKRKTIASIEETAVELLQLYAQRQVSEGHAFEPETAWQREMESAFVYDETPDQLAAWEAVRRDMEEPRPMDHLVCGDVGFGKTEIAIRAAFKAVQDGKQVALLSPTTILADQHLHTFRERLAAFPVHIESLSRFRTPREQSEVLDGLASRKIDIVIGTHRLLSEDVELPDLGLLIVDEEQRFGVRQKERLKQIKRSVDVLTLTATPIPRTLHLALGGIRDLSRIETAPRDRMPIITHVLTWLDDIIEDGLQRELDRGGQVFFVHDRVETIQPLAARVRALVPDARVEVAHGQMHERELERVMHDLMAREIDVLICTSIIENGLDVPTANTMIVHRADRFGLGQLYQLRGRVGRSHRRAYFYLIVPSDVTREAESRLRVLEHHTELGAGFQVALKDLELRGAGNLLGAQQSGFATAVGLETYQRLVTNTVRRLKGETGHERAASTQVSVEGEAYLPDAYIGGSEQKMHLYRRLSRLTEQEAVTDLREELRDRFGPLPAPAQRLLDAAELRSLGACVDASWIRVSEDGGRITFVEDATPQLVLLKNALGDKQLDVEVRRLQPLSLVLRRAGTEPLLPTLVEALRLLATASGETVRVAAGGS
jgi:transcription-repair coupling factor (superfamily II helicase)